MGVEDCRLLSPSPASEMVMVEAGVGVCRPSTRPSDGDHTTAGGRVGGLQGLMAADFQANPSYS